MPGPPTPEKCNDYIAAIAAARPDTFIGYASVNPAYRGPAAAVRELERAVRDLGLTGLKLYPMYQDWSPADPVIAFPVFEKAEELGIPVMVHQAGSTRIDARMEYARPALLDAAGRHFRDLRLTIAHCGLPWVDEAMFMLTKHPNFYAELSYHIASVTTEELLRFLVHAQASFVPLEKLFFGTDYPGFLYDPVKLRAKLLDVNSHAGAGRLRPHPPGQAGRHPRRQLRPHARPHPADLARPPPLPATATRPASPASPANRLVRCIVVAITPTMHRANEMGTGAPLVSVRVDSGGCSSGKPPTRTGRASTPSTRRSWPRGRPIPFPRGRPSARPAPGGWKNRLGRPWSPSSATTPSPAPRRWEPTGPDAGPTSPRLPSSSIPPARAGEWAARSASTSLSWSRAEGFHGIQFNAVVEANHPAVHLWRSLGFDIIGTVPEAFDHPDHGSSACTSCTRNSEPQPADLECVWPRGGQQDHDRRVRGRATGAGSMPISRRTRRLICSTCPRSSPSSTRVSFLWSSRTSPPTRTVSTEWPVTP